jgi:hypothetical protein
VPTNFPDGAEIMLEEKVLNPGRDKEQPATDRNFTPRIRQLRQIATDLEAG